MSQSDILVESNGVGFTNLNDASIIIQDSQVESNQSDQFSEQEPEPIIIRADN